MRLGSPLARPSCVQAALSADFSAGRKRQEAQYGLLAKVTDDLDIAWTSKAKLSIYNIMFCRGDERWALQRCVIYIDGTGGITVDWNGKQVGAVFVCGLPFQAQRLLDCKGPPLNDGGYSSLASYFSCPPLLLPLPQ